MGEVLRRLCSRLVCSRLVNSRLRDLILDVPFAVRDRAVAVGRWWGGIRWQVLDTVRDVPAIARGLLCAARALPARGAGLVVTLGAGAWILVVYGAQQVRTGLADDARRVSTHTLEMRIALARRVATLRLAVRVQARRACLPLLAGLGVLRRGALGRPYSWLKANSSRAAALAGAPLVPALAVLLAIEAHSVRPSAATPPALRDASPPAIAPTAAVAAAGLKPSHRARANIAPPLATVPLQRPKGAAVTRRTPTADGAHAGQRPRTEVTRRVVAPRGRPTSSPRAASPGKTAPLPVPAELPRANGDREQPPAHNPPAQNPPAQNPAAQNPAAQAQPPAPSQPAPPVEAATAAPPQVAPAGQTVPSGTTQAAAPVHQGPSQGGSPATSPPQAAPPTQSPATQPPAPPRNDDDDELRDEDEEDEDEDDRKQRSKGKNDHRDDDDDDDDDDDGGDD